MTVSGSTGTRRRGRPGYDLATLLPVAVELFNERGYDGTSMRDLAARLGIAKSAIYHHVTGKEELLSLALDRALDGLAAVTSRVRALPAPAVDRLEYLVRGSVEVLEALDGRGRKRAGAARRRGQAVQGPVQGHAEQFLLARDVVVDGRFGDPEPGGQVPHARAVVASLVEQVDGDRQHRGEIVAGPTAAPGRREHGRGAHEAGPSW